MIQVRYATPKRTRKSMQRMEVSIVESVEGCNTENKDEHRQKNMANAGIKQLRRPERRHRGQHCVSVTDGFILFASEEGHTIYVLQHRTRSFAARHYYYIDSGVPENSHSYSAHD